MTIKNVVKTAIDVTSGRESCAALAVGKVHITMLLMTHCSVGVVNSSVYTVEVKMTVDAPV